MVSRPDPAMDTVGEALPSRLVAAGIDAVAVVLLCGTLWLVGVTVRFVVDDQLALLGGGPLAHGGVSVAGVAIWALTWVAVLGAAGAYYAGGYALLGQSIGQRMVDVVVVTTDGGPCDGEAALLRAGVRLAPVPVAAVLALLFGGMGVAVGVALLGAWYVVDLVAVLVDDAGRSLGDRLAGTVVAEEALARV